MGEWYGFIGKLARVNLTNKTVLKEPLREDIAKKYLGCVGYAAKLLWDELKPGIDPLGPDNKLIIATGPLTGTLCPGPGSWEAVFKSPLTGIWAESRAGGDFGPELKFAGFDMIVLEGKAEKLVYLWVHDGEVEIRDASHLVGKTIPETEETIREELEDPDVKVACIGPAGEKLSRIACIISDLDAAAGRCGGGAVMGSKNVKAVAVRGHGDITIHNPEAFSAAVQEAVDTLKSNAFADMQMEYGTAGLVHGLNEDGILPTKYGETGYFEKAENISGETLAKTYLVKIRACFGCPIGCRRYTEVKFGPWISPPYGGPEYETIGSFGSWLFNDNLEAIIKASHLCNIYGLDTISCGNVIAFAMECYEKGIITDKDTEGVKLTFGNVEAIITMVEKIARREGLGDILADGVVRASKKIGKGTSELAMHVKGLETPMHEARGMKTFAIHYATTNRGMCHMHPYWVGFFDYIGEDAGLKPHGLPENPDRFSEAGVGKGLAVKLLHNFGTVHEVLGLCRFPSWGSADDCLTPKRYAALLSAAIGWSMDEFELMKILERVYTLERCFNVREGIRRKDDNLPKRLFEPIKTGPIKGHAVKNLDAMLDEYYEASGWDKATGIPTHKKLKELDLEDVSHELKKYGIPISE